MSNHHTPDANARLERTIGNMMVNLDSADSGLHDVLSNALQAADGTVSALHSHCSHELDDQTARNAAWAALGHVEAATAAWNELHRRRREAAPRDDSRLGISKPLTSAAATIRDAIPTLQDIGLNLRDIDDNEASAVLTVVAALRDADGELEAYLTGGSE